jgi:integrase/recombinase XerD
VHYLSDFSIEKEKEVDMHKEQLSVVSPSYSHSTQPLDLHSRLTGSVLHQRIDEEIPTVEAKKDSSYSLDSARQCILERILDKISRSHLPEKDYFTQYLRHKYRRNCRPNTLRTIDQCLTKFLSFYRDSGKHHISQMTRDDVEAFIEHLQDHGLKPNSVRTRLCALYAFMRFLIEKKVLGYELLERRIKIKLPERLPRAIDPEDLKQLLSVINHARDRALILLLLRTGMRIGELLNTRVNDIDLREQKILIYQASKTGVGRVVYYSADAQEVLLAWLKIRDPFKENLFYGQGRQSLSYESARAMFIKYLQKAGLLHSGYTLHCLRHTFATDLLNARMPLECLRVLLGHTNLEVTRIYARLTDKTRELEYFAAMARILKGDYDADDQCDC